MSFGLRVGGDLLEWGDEVRVLELEAIPLFSDIQYPISPQGCLQYPSNNPLSFTPTSSNPTVKISDEDEGIDDVKVKITNDLV